MLCGYLFPLQCLVIADDCDPFLRGLCGVCNPIYSVLSIFPSNAEAFQSYRYLKEASPH